MKLEDVIAEVRPRGRWESIDFGCAMVRSCFGSIFRVLLVTIIPLWVLLAIVMQDLNPGWLLLVYWLTLPFASRAVLYVLSRHLFGETVTVWQVFRQWPKMISRRLFHGLLIGRFSPSRSLALPVSELEGLRGKDYSNRVRLLERNGGDGAAQTALIGWLLILVTAMGLFGLLQILTPFSIELLEIDENFLWNDGSSQLLWTWAVSLYAFGALLVEPFCVGAGFAMYVNSRTITEGWDIELAFKRMSARLEGLKGSSYGVGPKLGLWLSLVLWFCVLPEPSLQAEESQFDPSAELQLGTEIALHSEEQKVVSRLYSDKDFKVHTKTIQVPVEELKNKNTRWNLLNWLDLPPIPGLVLILELLLYAFITACLVALAFVIAKNKHVFSVKPHIVNPQGPKQRVKSVMGMDVTAESLPSDIVAAARAAWLAGEARSAMSLLYRGSISWYADHTHVDFRDSDTERDCVSKLESVPEISGWSYFRELTSVWTALAYGKKTPEEDTMEHLFSAWPFSSPAAGATTEVTGGTK